MDKNATSSEIEKLRNKLSDAIDNCTSLTDENVIACSVLLDHALNQYFELIEKDL